MIKLKALIILLFIGLQVSAQAQHKYYKVVTPAITAEFKDTLKKIVFKTPDNAAENAPVFNFILRFYPNLLFKTLNVYSKPSKKITKIKPGFFSIFKSPENRTYKLYFSSNTNSTVDSVLLKSLSFNSKVGLIGKQISIMQDLSTTHFFGFIGWYFKHLSKKAINKTIYDAEFKMLEVGLGYQLLSLANETNEKLKIEKWKTPKGYATYIKQTEGRYMPPGTIQNFINDLPVYVSNQYK